MLDQTSQGTKLDVNTLMRSAVDNAGVSTMMCDRDLNIIYLNQATADMIRKNIDVFRNIYPRVDFSNLVGVCIDVFHKNPATQRNLLNNPKNLPYSTDITVGPLTFRLNVTAIYDATGNHVGACLLWSDNTEMVLKNADFQGQLAAIRRAQAVIEFNLDGTIITANDNFLNAMGYSLDEIKGKHHRIFVESGEQNSHEYRQFWQDLNEGKFFSREFKRVAKGGREIYLQASYNPILDAKGKPYKVVKFASDITTQTLKNSDYQGQLAAIGKSQAVIEFKLDGTIITANENFLSTMGFSLDEVKGKHHRIFVEPAEQNSHEYRQFWQDLNNGKFFSKEYKRVAKGGRAVYLQASYNPILDPSGRPYKVVKFGSDITESTIGKINYLHEVDRLLTELKAGNLQSRGDVAKMTTEYKTMVSNINDVVEAIVAPMAEIKEKLGEIAQGDMQAYVTGDYLGDHATLKDALNNTLDSLNDLAQAAQEISAGNLTIDIRPKSEVDTMGKAMSLIASSLNTILGQITVSGEEISKGSSQIADSSQVLSQGATEQASSLEQINASMHEISSQAQQNADNASAANKLANGAKDSAATGDSQMKEMIKAMSSIAEASQNISKIIKVIDEIAFQTNLLALNAAVEAARAGAHGKGFAVVANEVRNLARRSAEAAKETTAMIEDSARKVNQGIDIANRTGTALSEIVLSISKVTDLVSEIAASSKEQAAGAVQISQGLNQLDQVTQQNSAVAEESAAASEELAGQSVSLKEQLAKFQLRKVPTMNVAGMSQGLTPELMAAFQQFMMMQQQQALVQLPPPKPAARGAVPARAGSPKATPPRGPVGQTPRGQKVDPTKIISLDDKEYGRY